MDSAYSVPESWQSGGQSFTYTITLPVPITLQVAKMTKIPTKTSMLGITQHHMHGITNMIFSNILQKENTVVIPNGLLRTPGEKVV